MWNKTQILCPICGGVTESQSDRLGGVTCESEDRCTDCRLWNFSYTYGSNEEWIGFVMWQWSYNVSKVDHLVRVAYRNLVLEEIKRVVHNPDFKKLLKGRMDILADWLDDNNCPLQAKEARGYGGRVWSLNTVSSPEGQSDVSIVD